VKNAGIRIVHSLASSRTRDSSSTINDDTHRLRADWTHPNDPDAKITKMKDGRTHLAHKAEHAVDLETGAIVGVTVQDADEGDTTTSRDTLIAAAEQIETVWPGGHGLIEVVADKGYHSNESLVDLEAVGVRSYISEPDRGRRNWKKDPGESRCSNSRARERVSRHIPKHE
jgi:hypothetical protein